MYKPSTPQVHTPHTPIRRTRVGIVSDKSAMGQSYHPINTVRSTLHTHDGGTSLLSTLLRTCPWDLSANPLSTHRSFFWAILPRVPDFAIVRGLTFPSQYKVALYTPLGLRRTLKTPHLAFRVTFTQTQSLPTIIVEVSSKNPITPFSPYCISRSSYHTPQMHRVKNTKHGPPSRQSRKSPRLYLIDPH